MRKYTHPLTKEITPDNWQEKIDLDSLSLNDLSSLFGDFKNQEAFSKKMSGFLREVIISRMPEGEDEFDGPYFHLERTFGQRQGGLDKLAILEEMGEEWVEDHSKEPIEYTMLKVSRREEGGD